MIEDLKEKVENGIKNIAENGIEREELDTLYKLVDIHKDLANEEYWEKKKEVMEMRYRDYDREEYGRRRRDSRGRYMESGRSRGMYRDHEPMEEMYEAYQEYSEGREEYGHDDKGTMQALEYMLEAGVDFFKKLKEDAGSEQELNMIKHYSRKISEML